MASLATIFVFTSLDDNAISSEDWTINRDQTVRALSGNDIIIGSGANGNPAIYIEGGVLDTGKDDDSVIGNGGINDNGGDDGNDGYGIANYDGTITTGNGNDVITGNGGNGGIGYGGDIGIVNYGTITTGNGNDAITGNGDQGILNVDDGDPNDKVFGGVITTGNGNDTITGNGTSGFGINNFINGTISTGNGNDTIIGNGGINNIDGMIATGNGTDIVDARVGGFSGSGTTDLGKGNDTLIGFGAGSFIGGRGSDSILLVDGSYTISVGAFTFINANATTMSLSGFEQIGGVSGGLFSIANGTLTVAGGVASYS